MTSSTQTVTLNGRNYTSTYNAVAKTVTQATPAGRQTILTLDASARVVQVQPPGALTIARAPTSGYVTGTALGSVTDSRTYNSFGEPQSYSASSGTTALYSTDYGTRDGLGRIVTKTETVQGVLHTYGYSYDAVGRLTDVTKDGVLASHYAYDANGNRTSAPGLTAGRAAVWIRGRNAGPGHRVHIGRRRRSPSPLPCRRATPRAAVDPYDAETVRDRKSRGLAPCGARAAYERSRPRGEVSPATVRVR